jgi:hypothetical protein
MKQKQIKLVDGMICPVCGSCDDFSVGKFAWKLRCVQCGTTYENHVAWLIIDSACDFNRALCTDDELLTDDRGYQYERRDIDFGAVALDAIYRDEGGDTHAMPFYQ